MKKFTAKSSLYLILSFVGIAFSIYSLRIKNYVLLAVAVLFAAVSADNVFCNLKAKK